MSSMLVSRRFALAAALILTFSTCGFAALSREGKALKEMHDLKMNESFEEYSKGHDEYLKTIQNLIEKKSESRRIKWFYIGAVLKFLNGPAVVGLGNYAKTLKESGDGKYKDKKSQIDKAISYCDELLKYLANNNEAKNRENRKIDLKFQKAELLMYRWLVINAEYQKGEKVGGFPDDKGDRGVDDREEAVRILAVDAWKHVNARELVKQCVNILISDSGWGRVYFNGDYYYFDESLRGAAENVFQRRAK